jgi:hypothetical protein
MIRKATFAHAERFEGQCTICACPDAGASGETNVKRIKYKKCMVVRNESVFVMKSLSVAPKRCQKMPKLREDAHIMSILYKTTCHAEVVRMSVGNTSSRPSKIER